MTRDVQALVAYVRRTIGPVSDDGAPVGYEDLDVAVIDSIYSLGVNYGGVRAVVARYRKYLAKEGLRDRPSISRLVDVLNDVGAETFAQQIVDNRWRTSSRNGVLKSEAVHQAARTLRDHGIETIDDLVSHADDGAVEQARRKVRGQRSGLSWEYLLMLCGLPRVKADRMVRRFVGHSVGRAVDAHEAARLVQGAGRHLGCDPRALDHAIWRYQSGRS